MSAETSRCPQCGALVTASATMCGLCFAPLAASDQATPPRAAAPPMMTGSAAPGYVVVRRLADYYRWSGYAWLCLGAVQVFLGLTGAGLLLFLAVVGALNILAGLSRIGMAGVIAQRHPAVPHCFQGLAQLAIIAVVNLVFGAVVGLVLVVVDLFVRDQILRNAHLFDNTSAQPQVVR